MICTVKIYTDSGLNTLKQTEVGTKLLDAINASGHGLNAPCGGRGTCGKCRVKAKGALSPLTETELGRLTQEELEAGVRLACMTVLEGDAEVWLEQEQARILVAGEEMQIALEPRFAVEKINVPAPSLENQRADLERMQGVIDCSDVSLQALKKLPDALRHAQNGIWILRDVLSGRIEDVSAQEIAVYGAAIDIGTTTIAAYLVDLKTGATIGTCSAMNPQRAYGADVISRIDYARGNGGLDTLQREIAGKIDELVAHMLCDIGAKREDLRQICCVGNTVMVHLLLGVSPEYIAATPFVSAFTGRRVLGAEKLGMDFCNAIVETGPCVAGYIGADTTAAVLACDMDKKEEISLLIDIGTNGEIVLGSRNEMVCCSAAAGPAFEGAHIRCGSGAVKGAISGVKLTDDGEVYLTTIGDATPTSICGSGIVDAIAQMLHAGIIDETGRIDEDEAPECWEDHIFDSPAGLAFALTQDESVYICQKDIREVQLAKGAIAAGIEILKKQTGVCNETIQSLFLAGGFGNYIDVHNACAIGLLPPEMEEKTVAVGNAAGTGARMMTVNRICSERADRIARNMRYIELSSQKDFTELFSENMLFEE